MTQSKSDLTKALRILLNAVPAGTQLHLDAASLRELVHALRGEEATRLASVSDVRELPADLFFSATEIAQSGREMSVKEAADYLKVTRQAVLSQVRRGAIQARRVGKVHLVDGVSVYRYREQQLARRASRMRGDVERSEPEPVAEPPQEQREV